MRWLILMLFCWSLTSCGEYEVLEHNKKLRKKVDSLYRVNRDSLITIADSICDQNYNIYLTVAKDSLEIVRVKEIEQLIEK